jgi:hypothetical protein
MTAVEDGTVNLEELRASARQRAATIREASLDIYTPIDPFNSDLFFPDAELEVHLDSQLRGEQLGGPIRSRSKLAKQLVAEALGYDRPTSFRRTVPRFPGQDLDVHVQQDNNLQIWNQEVSPERRYVLIRPSSDDIVQRVRVVRGEQVAEWDRTGTLTSKFQAKRIAGRTGSALLSESDTSAFVQTLKPTPLGPGLLWDSTSSDPPTPGLVMPITQLFERLMPLVGMRLDATGAGQDRVRGELLQASVSDLLGIGEYANFGQWPDIVNQALEVKLQTSPTIDLGLVLPTDTALARALGPGIRHCDARYLVAYGELLSSSEVEIQALVLVTGADFFTEFVQFGGLVTNSKRQIRLPNDLF